eukprot:620060-Rhodomonas_salina.1
MDIRSSDSASGMLKQSESRSVTGLDEGYASEPSRFECEGRGKKKLQLSQQFHCAFFAPIQHLTCPRASATLLHQEPHIWLIDSFVTESQMQLLENVIQARKNFKSSYAEDTNGNKVYGGNRTSKFHCFAKAQNTILAELERKAADVTGLPPDHVEAAQVVRYAPGDSECFELHHDSGSIIDEEKGLIELPKSSEPLQLATVFVYLFYMPPGNGGCTVFPKLSIEQAKHTEAKFQLVDQLFQEELKEGDSLPPSDVESKDSEEIECSPSTLFVMLSAQGSMQTRLDGEFTCVRLA